MGDIKVISNQNLDPVYGLDWTKTGNGTVIGIVQETKSNDILAAGLITQSGLEFNLRSQKRQSPWAGKIVLNQVVVTRDIYCNCDRDMVLLEVEKSEQCESRLLSRYEDRNTGEIQNCPRCDRNRCQILAVAQDQETGEVQMAGMMNQGALSKTLQTGKATFWSKNDKRIWTKGETFGNYLSVIKVMIDHQSCSVLLITNANAPVCHTGAMTCFRKIDGSMREYVKE